MQLVGGDLPPGIRVGAAEGTGVGGREQLALSGTPTTPGEFVFRLRVTAAGCEPAESVEQVLHWTVPSP
jgi:hypothetical protein